MRVVLQRVLKSELVIDNKLYSEINRGFLLLIGVEHEDKKEDIDWLVNKILNLRIFADENKKMNLSIKDIDGELLLVSQFTLFASTKKGNRPSFIKSAKPDYAKKLYQEFVDTFRIKYSKEKIKTGVFAADMQITLTNDGPVTILLDSKNKE